MIVGRYAPSPTGALHLGNLRTALAAWASAKSRGGRFLLRIEDIDRARCKESFRVQQLHDLEKLGVTWDAEPLIQSERLDVYTEQFQRLVTARLVYPCFCSRKEIAEVLSAPHGSASSVYPGTCARLPWSESVERVQRGFQHCWRLRVDGSPSRFFDALLGECAIDLRQNGGDFVVRRADGLFAYQFVCAIDDGLCGVTEVVRANDLLDSGARQAWLLECLGMPIPRYLHLTMMHGIDGVRLSKRAGSEDMSGFASRGFTPIAIRSYLAWTLGLCAAGEQLTMEEVAARWDWRRVPRENVAHDERQMESFRQ